MALINCPSCGKQISDKAEKCPHCGNVFSVTSDSPEEEKEQICPECGFIVPKDARACPACGCPVTGTEKSRAENTEAPEKQNEAVQEKGDSAPGESESAFPSRETMSMDPGKEEAAKDPSGAAIAAGGMKKPVSGKVIIAIIAALVIAAIAVFFGTANMRAYSQAKKAYDAGEYSIAYDALTALGEYKDSKNLADDCMYHMAEADYQAEEYGSAKEKYQSIESYKDSAEKVKDCEYQLSVDGRFLRELVKGLEERWDQNSKDAKSGPEDEAAALANYCDIELKHVETFEKEKFNDETLGKDALSYIELLRAAREATTYYNVDFSKYDTDWGHVYSQRTQLLQKMVNDYDLTFDEKYQTTVNDLMRDASASAKLEAAKKEIQKMADSFELTSTADEDGYREYSIHMKNTTKYTFDYFYVDISLLDENGDIVDTGNAEEVNNWVPNQSADVDAWISNDTDPSAYRISFYPHYNTADGTIYD